MEILKAVSLFLANLAMAGILSRTVFRVKKKKGLEYKKRRHSDLVAKDVERVDADHIKQTKSLEQDLTRHT